MALYFGEGVHRMRTDDDGWKSEVDSLNRLPGYHRGIGAIMVEVGEDRLDRQSYASDVEQQPQCSLSPEHTV